MEVRFISCPILRGRTYSYRWSLGIAGLACALALRRVGHHVQVLERTDKAAAVGVLVGVCPLVLGSLEPSLSARLGWNTSATEPLEDPLPLGTTRIADGQSDGHEKTRLHAMSVYIYLFSLLLNLMRSFYHCKDDTGERLGEQVWDEEMLKETRGIFLIMAVRASFLGTPLLWHELTRWFRLLAR